jgi:hypothetical protein
MGMLGRRNRIGSNWRGDGALLYVERVLRFHVQFNLGLWDHGVGDHDVRTARKAVRM